MGYEKALQDNAYNAYNVRPLDLVSALVFPVIILLQLYNF